MDEDVIANIRGRVERCRRLAASTTDREVAAMLIQMAEEGEADLEQMRGDGAAADDGAAAHSDPAPDGNPAALGDAAGDNDPAPDGI